MCQQSLDIRDLWDQPPKVAFSRKLGFKSSLQAKVRGSRFLVERHDVEASLDRAVTFEKAGLLSPTITSLNCGLTVVDTDAVVHGWADGAGGAA